MRGLDWLAAAGLDQGGAVFYPVSGLWAQINLTARFSVFASDMPHLYGSDTSYATAFGLEYYNGQPNLLKTTGTRMSSVGKAIRGFDERSIHSSESPWSSSADDLTGFYRQVQQ